MTSQSWKFFDLPVSETNRSNKKKTNSYLEDLNNRLKLKIINIYDSLILCHKGILNNFQRINVFFIPFLGVLFPFSCQWFTLLLAFSRNHLFPVFL